MDVLIERKYKKDTYTIGNLYIDGQWFCNTLEDKDRGLDSLMSLEEINKKKVYGETAIPTGIYRLNMKTVSPKFKNASWAKVYKGIVPRLENVKGYEGVLIHVGNWASDTLGCILVGENRIKGGLTKSTETYWKLMNKLLKADGAIRLEIK